MRLVTLAAVALLAGCGEKAPVVASTAAAPVAAPVVEAKTAPAPEPVWVATGPAQTTIPAAFHGRWDATAATCLEISTAEAKIDAKTMTFWEIGIEARIVTPVGPNTYKIEGKGHEEDQTYDASVVVRISDDGDTLTLDPGPNEGRRVRCLTPDFPGPELEKKMLQERQQQ